MQWLPYKWYFQILYIIYRWVVAVYFFVWLFPTGFYELNGGVKFFIFLTNWAILSFNIYLVWAAFSTTLHFLVVHCISVKKYADDSFSHGSSEYELEKPQGCCGIKSNGITWHQVIFWFLFVIGAETAIVISVLYWPLLYDPDSGSPSGVNVNTHLTNGIVALLDVFITGVPVRFFHFLYIQLFFSVYAGFTGIYHAANGTNVNNNPFIYSLLDYGNNPGSATGIVFGLILLYVPFIHILIYLAYLARYWLVYLACRPRGRSNRERITRDETEMKEADKAEP